MNDTPRTDAKEDHCRCLNDQAWGIQGWKFAEQLERELNAVTEQRDGLKQAVDCANDLLASVTEHRDKEREIYQKSYSAELARSNHYKEQRDRLTRQMQDACELIADIMRDEVNIVDECEKFLRAYAPELLFPTNQPNKQ